MIKIEAVTLEAAYKDAASKLECSVTELRIEVVQAPKKGILGLFKKPAIIVAVRESKSDNLNEPSKTTNIDTNKELKQASKEKIKEAVLPQEETKKPLIKTTENKRSKKTKQKVKTEEKDSHTILNDTIMPTSFVSMQDDEDDYGDDVSSYLADYDDEGEADASEQSQNISEIVATIKTEINELFDLTCFRIEAIDVSMHDEGTLLIEFKGEDAALLIGKEGYRYKALSYMIFNWINTKYQLQLRLEIAEFLKNQEESISKYLVGVCENIERDGRAQTKILDGVLVQIALNELRDKYPDKYIVIRSTRDGLKYIIINDYHSN